MKQRTLFAKKRGFQCHFIVKVMVRSPHITILTYNMYEHEDEQGWPCHGQHDTSGNARTLHKPNLSRDIVSYVESCYFLGVQPDYVYKCTSRDMSTWMWQPKIRIFSYLGKIL